MNSENIVVFLFGSVQRPLYKANIYNALSYPDGLILHYRYRKDKVLDKIWNKEFDELVGKNALSIAISKDLNNKPVFFPLRKSKIVKTEVDGNTLHVYAEPLSDWVDYPIDNSGKITHYDDIIKKFDKIPKESNKEFLEGKFICYGDISEIAFSKEISAWNKIVETIGNNEQFKNGLFYRIVRLYDASSNENIKISRFDEDELTRGYALKGGRRYIMEISFDFGKEPPEPARKVSFRMKSLDLIKAIPTNIKLGFRVDKTKFSLSPEKTFWNQDTYISMKMDEPIEGSNIELHFKIKRTNEAYIYGLMVLSGLILATGIFDSQMPVQLTSYLFGIKLFGTVLTTTGTWLLTGYKR
jgi:hypothetical protein